MSDPGAYYVAVGPGRYRSTAHTEGAWSTDHQHMAPASGLLVEAIETCSPRTDLFTSRVAFDILGVISAGEVQVRAQVIRPGRTIELVEAEMIISGRPVVRATAWRLTRSDTSDIAGTDLEALPVRAGAERWTHHQLWQGGYIRSVDVRVLPGWKPGRAQVWVSTPVALVEQVPTTDLARFFSLVDVANGIAVRGDPRELLFPNTDLTVHLFRRPVGTWVGLDTTVSFGPDGVGLTDSVLHDEQGPVGRSAQTLTLRRA